MVGYELQDTVAVLTMDDGKANALSPAMLRELNASFDRADKEAAAVVLAGRPSRLSAGFDLSVMMSGAAALHDLVLAGAESLLRMYLHPRPIVVACTGHALAAGAILLLVADYRIGTRGSFKIGLNEVAIQMTLPIFAMELARDRLSKRHFTAATTQATIYDPDRALEAGYLDAVESPENVMETSIGHARRLAALPHPAFYNTKLRERSATVDMIRASLHADIAKLTAPLPG